MTVREADQYESQGWPHIHIWEFSHTSMPLISVYKCRCGKCKVNYWGNELILPSWKLSN